MSNPSLGDLPKKLAKPPLPTSTQLANQVMNYIQSNPMKLFPKYNEPQLAAIRSALTRRLTLIQGPPAFIPTAKSLQPHLAMLALPSLGLKVVRVGKPSGVSETTCSHTLDAATQYDPNAQKALDDAARITAKINKVSNEGNRKRANSGSPSAKRAKRDAATDAVKASIQAWNIAAPRALREADVIVATSIGAADAQLLAACGIYPDEGETTKSSTRKAAVDTRPRT